MTGGGPLITEGHSADRPSRSRVVFEHDQLRFMHPAADVDVADASDHDPPR